MCLALNMFFEARNEEVGGMLAVGLVTMNRVEDTRYPDDVCSVVWQKKQFSWTHDGKHDDPTRFKAHADRVAWREAQLLADGLLNDEGENPLEGVTMYHADYVQPYWTTSYEYVGKIGSHLFYK